MENGSDKGSDHGTHGLDVSNTEKVEKGNDDQLHETITDENEVEKNVETEDLAKEEFVEEDSDKADEETRTPIALQGDDNATDSDEECVDRRRRKEEHDSEVDSEKEGDNQEDSISKGKAVNRNNEEDFVEENDDEDYNINDNDEEGWVEESDKQLEAVEGKSDEDNVAKNSPMFVPKGRFYFHDSRFDPESKGEEDSKDVQKTLPTKPSQTVEKWKHDMYDPELQKPREEWEKERDRKYYEEMDRRQSGESSERQYGRANKGTRFGQYLPRTKENSRTSGKGEERQSSYQKNERQGDWGRRVDRQDHGDSQTSRGRQQTARNDHRDKRRNDGRGWNGDKRKEWKGERRQQGGEQRMNRRERENNWQKQRNQEKEESWDEEPTTTSSSVDAKETLPRNKHQSLQQGRSEQVNHNYSEDWDKEATDTVHQTTRNDHTGSLFLRKAEDSGSNEIFTSKVFSLNSQTNKLIVKDAPPEQKRALGRGRGRIVKEPTHSKSTYPGGLTNMQTSSVDKKQVEVTNFPKSSETGLTDGDDQRDETIADSVDKDGGTKPKRYSSRRQKTGPETDNRESPEKSSIAPVNDDTRIHSQPPLIPYQWPTPYPAPVMMDPITQQQMMVMMQQMAYFQHHMLYPDGVPTMPPPSGHPPILPSGDVPHHAPPPGPVPQPSNSSNGGSSNSTSESKPPGLFIPPVPPDQQRMMQSPKIQKQSQAIPIVSPKIEDKSTL